MAKLTVIEALNTENMVPLNAGIVVNEHRRKKDIDVKHEYRRELTE